MESENLIEKPRIYFGHAISLYDTPKEAELVRIIQEHFPEYAVENPNQPHHAAGYKQAYKVHGNGMIYFVTKILPKMEAGIFTPFEDGLFGSGVYKELIEIHAWGKPVFQLTLDGKISNVEIPMLSIEETRARVRPPK